jgi:hypothetical protein
LPPPNPGSLADYRVHQKEGAPCIDPKSAAAARTPNAKTRARAPRLLTDALPGGPPENLFWRLLNYFADSSERDYFEVISRPG